MNKRTHRIGLGSLLSFTLLIGVATPPEAAHALAFANGSFESCTGNAQACTFPAVQKNVGNTSINGWQVVGGAIDYLGTGEWNAADGVRSIDLNSNVAGGIQQTFDTVGGTIYDVVFSMSGNVGGLPLIKQLRLSAGNESQDFSFDIGATQGPPLPLTLTWEDRTFSFTADGSSTTLTFTSLVITGGNPEGFACGGSPVASPPCFGAAIDNVRVSIQPASDAPEPASLVLMGLGLAGIYLSRRKNS